MASIVVSLAHASVAAGQMTSGRAQSLAALAVGLIAVTIGVLALSRSAGGRRERRGIVALIVGLIGLGLGGSHLATITGAIGTGSGKLGAIVAIVVALIGAALGGLAILRARRAR